MNICTLIIILEFIRSAASEKNIFQRGIFESSNLNSDYNDLMSRLNLSEIKKSYYIYTRNSISFMHKFFLIDWVYRHIYYETLKT